MILKPQLDESKEQLAVMELCQWGLALPAVLFSAHSKSFWIFFSYLSILVLCTFPFALRGAEVTSVCFVIGSSALFLWQRSGGELACVWRKAFWEVQSPWIWWQVFLQAAWRLTGRGEIPALSGFGFGPEIAPHKMFKEVLEYLSKGRRRTVFVHFQQLHPVCAAWPRVSAEVRGFCHLIHQRRGSKSPNPNVYCSLSML